MQKRNPKKTNVNSPEKPVLRKKSDSMVNYRPWIFLAVVIVFTAFIRIRLLQIPLERDEGEYAYIGQLMLQGIPPYLQAYSMKLPGIYAVYSLVMAVFGQTVSGIHLGLLLANSGAVILLFILIRRLFDDVAGIVAAAGYALISVSPSVLGTSAHATQFIVPAVLGGVIILLKALDRGKISFLVLSGLLFGLAFIIKQHAVFFILFALVYYTFNIIRIKPLNWKRLLGGNLLLVAGSVSPFIITCIILYNAGVFPKFWFWTFTYAREYASYVPLTDAISLLLANVRPVINSWSLFWIIAGFGITTVFWNDKAKFHRFFLLGFTIFSFLTVCPGFHFREHYFITFLPSLAMLAGIATTSAMQWLAKKGIPSIMQIVPGFIIAASLIWSIITFGDFYFKATPAEACRFMYEDNPFSESVEIARYIREHTTEQDSVAVVGSEPQIYFYSNRKSATGYIYVYGLMEPHDYAAKMQVEMIREIETAKPKYLVFVNVFTSWLETPKSDQTIFTWMRTYLHNYQLRGISECSVSQCSTYWDEKAITRKPASSENVTVWERAAR